MKGKLKCVSAFQSQNVIAVFVISVLFVLDISCLLKISLFTFFGVSGKSGNKHRCPILHVETSLYYIQRNYLWKENKLTRSITWPPNFALTISFQHFLCQIELQNIGTPRINLNRGWKQYPIHKQMRNPMHQKKKPCSIYSNILFLAKLETKSLIAELSNVYIE